MARVVYTVPVDHLSGKLARSNELIFCFRQQSGCCYTMIRGQRRTACSDTEIAHRQRFRAARKAVLDRARKPENAEADRTAWRTEQRKNGTNYSFQGWLFKEEWSKNNPNELPVNP